MNFNINKFDNQLETYIKKLKKNGTMQIELEEREERKLYYQKYDANKIIDMTEDEFHEYISKLWAMIIWGNKEYIINKYVEDNGFDNLKKSIAELKKEQDAAAEKRAEQIAAVEESNKKEKELNDIKAKIKDFCIANKGKAAALKPLLALAKEKGYENPMAVDDINVAKEILALTAA